MNRMKSVLIALAIVLTAGSAKADYSVMVPTQEQSCGGWIAHRGNRMGAEDWVLSFLTGAAAATSFSQDKLDPLNDVDEDSVYLWIDNYCRGHPLAKLLEATVAFANYHPR